jgi:hypothetical protein
MEGLALMQDGPQDVDATAGQGDDGLVVPFSFLALAAARRHRPF